MLFHLLRRRLRSRFQNRMTVVTVWSVLAGLALTVLVSSILVARAEGTPWTDGLWQVWQTVTTVGYGDGPAKTAGGRIVTVLYSVTGILLFSKLIAAVADHRENVREKLRYGFMTSPQTNGYVVLQYPGASRFLTLVDQIRILEPRVGICLVDNALEELPPEARSLENIHFIKGRLIDRETYAQARLSEAKDIVIFPNPALGADADGATRTVVELVEQAVPSTVRVTFVLADIANEWMFKNCRATSVQGDIEILALVQEVQDRHTAAAIQSLLSNTSGANPNTLIVDRTAGMTWGDFVVRLVQASVKEDIPVTPFALVRDGQPDHCPPYATKLSKGDEVILISSESLDWPALESRLMA